MTALIPVVAISPILLYIGMLIGSQAFQESPHKHAPAVIMAIVPSLAAWGKLQIDNSLGAVANIHQVTPDMVASMAQTGVFYHGLAILGGGSILCQVVLGAITTYIVDRKFMAAAGFAFAGAVLTFFGLMHGEAIGFDQTPAVALSYVMVGGSASAVRNLPPPTPKSRNLWKRAKMERCPRSRPSKEPLFSIRNNAGAG